MRRCHGYCTTLCGWRFEPITTSAPSRAIASKNHGVCLGWMSRSPSSSITYSPEDASNPARSAAPFPPFRSQRTGRIVTKRCGGDAAAQPSAAARIAAPVPSAEPSSTGTSSARRACDSKSSAVARRFSATSPAML